MIWGEKMKYNEKLFVDFLENLIKFNQKSSELIEKASAEIERRNIDEKNEWNDTKKISDQQAETYSIKCELFIKVTLKPF
mgnify:CR=1 FL=1